MELTNFKIHRLILVVGLLCYGLSSNAQIPENLKTIQKKAFGKDAYYLELLPKDKAKGLIILMPGLFDHPYSIFFETTLTQECVKSGYIVMIPVLSKDNDHFDLSTSAMKNLGVMIEDLLASNKQEKDVKTVLGGFSIGGTRAISFYNYNSTVLNKRLKLNFVFGIDPPLDLPRLVESDQKRGSESLSKLLQKEVGGDVQTGKTTLRNNSVFSRHFTKPESLPDFLDSELRIYSEPDILWYIGNKKMDFYDLNIIDDAAYINMLKNKNIKNKVELIITQNKGYRKGTNEKNPHSWSILNVDEFLTWIK